MPPTGNNAAFVRMPEYGDMDDAVYKTLYDVAGVLNGVFGVPVQLIYNDSARQVLLVKQIDTSNGFIAQFQDGTGFALVDITQARTVIKPILHVRNTFDVTSLDAGTTYFSVDASSIDANIPVFILGVTGTGFQILDDTTFSLLLVAKTGTVIKPKLTVRDTFEVTSLDGATSYFKVDSTGITGIGPEIAKGTYTGNGSASLRTISIGSGWTPRYVVVQGGNSDATVELIHILSTSGAAYDDNLGNVRYTGAVKLGSTGSEFFVGDGSATPGNVNTRGYTWIAYK